MGSRSSPVAYSKYSVGTTQRRVANDLLAVRSRDFVLVRRLLFLWQRAIHPPSAAALPTMVSGLLVLRYLRGLLVSDLYHCIFL